MANKVLRYIINAITRKYGIAENQLVRTERGGMALGTWRHWLFPKGRKNAYALNRKYPNLKTGISTFWKVAITRTFRN